MTALASTAGRLPPSTGNSKSPASTAALDGVSATGRADGIPPPKRYSDVPDCYYPHASGLPGNYRSNGGEFDIATMPCVPLAEIDIADWHFVHSDELICFDHERGWGYHDRAKRWHAAPAETGLHPRDTVPAPGGAVVIPGAFRLRQWTQ
jgi:hypothetical protein